MVKSSFVKGIAGLTLLLNTSFYRVPDLQETFEEGYERTMNRINGVEEISYYKEYKNGESEEGNLVGTKFVENAKEYMGIQYLWGGRLTEKNPGLDCLGLLFRAYSKTFPGQSWLDISVYPSEIVEKGQLGSPVKDLSGCLKENINYDFLKEGDIVYLLGTNKINDAPLDTINGIKYWPWHTGIFSNKKDNLFLEAYPGGTVLERSFEDVLSSQNTKAIFVTRFP